MSREPLSYNATITERVDLAEGLALFRVRHDDEELFTRFIPGQYAILGLNHPEKGPVQRAYSIASAPSMLPEFEFYVRYVKQPASDNPLTHLLFAAHTGDRIAMGPKILGKFTLEHELPQGDTRWRVCVAAGTGLAPFTSMIFEEYHQTGAANGFLVLHGASYPWDLGYRERMEELLNTPFAQKRYYPTISRPKAEGVTWPADRMTGRVEELLSPEGLSRWEPTSPLGPGGLNPANAVIFICGLTGTIRQTLLNAFARGFVPGDRRLRRELEIPESLAPSVFFEPYDTEPILDLTNDDFRLGIRRQLGLQ
ncbi:MAG: FAD-binding oxidoreductase [Candidatus Sumerlaeia bacterium]|nr:FAD-binding oxidoreductase [Candidatus Sumerlaeia bacterium]